MTTSRFSAAGAGLAVASLLTASLLLTLPAMAAPAAAGPTTTLTVAANASPAGRAAAEPATTAAVAEEEPACERSRRRLWVDGEGWIVRRVTTCR